MIYEKYGCIGSYFFVEYKFLVILRLYLYLIFKYWGVFLFDYFVFGGLLFVYLFVCLVNYLFIVK